MQKNTLLMSSKDDNKGRLFIDSATNAQRNPQFIDLLASTTDKDNQISGAKLEITDYVAIFIALMETVFFPLVLLALILIGISFFLSIIA